MRHDETRHRIRQARTTLIDALRLVDMGMLPEAMVGCAMAMAFLAPVTNQAKAEEIVRTLINRVEKTE